MRIVNFIAEGRYGGPHARIIQVAKSLRHRGYQTTVVFPSRDADVFRAKLKMADVDFVEMRRLQRLTRGWQELGRYGVRFIPDVIELADILRATGAGIIHCNGSWQFQGVLAGRMAGVKTIWHLNDTYMPRPLPQVFRAIARRGADGFILSGERAKTFYLTDSHLQRRPSSVIRPPVDLARFDPTRTRPHPDIAQLPGLKVVTIANVNPTKDIDTFVRMCAGVRRLYDNVSFVVVGSEFPSQRAYSAQVRRLAQTLGVHVHFRGWVDDVASVLRAADVYVCSSVYESGPMAVWEAMAMGLPIVSTDVGDVARFVRDTCGHVVPVRDDRALCDAVAMLLDSSPLRKSLGERAREVAGRELGLSACADLHASIYDRVAHGR